MNSQKRVRQHKFVEKAPVAAALVMSILWFVMFQLIGLPVNGAISLFIDGYSIEQGIAGLAVSILTCLALYKLWFRPEFEGMLKGNLALGFLLGLIELGYVLISFVPGLLAGEALEIKPLSAAIIATSLTAGFGEELVFRGVLVSTLMRQWKDKGKFMAAAIISGVFFGLIHGTNIFAGADPGQTVLQMIGSVGIGIFFSAVYLRSGSVLPCMFYHTVHDIIAIAGESNVSDEGIITGSNINWTDWVNLVLTIILTAIGLWLLRAAKNGEMREIWNRKWKIETGIPGDVNPVDPKAGES